MIFAQETGFLKAQRQLEAMVALVKQAGEDQLRTDEVERGLLRQVLALGQTLLKQFVDDAGEGDEGERIEREGRTLQRLDARPRRYLSIFGELQVRRFVYARREGQRIEHVPTDARLGLPASDFSYVLEDWLGRLCVKESFAEAVMSLESLLGTSPSAASAERINQKMAEHAEFFRMHEGWHHFVVIDIITRTTGHIVELAGLVVQCDNGLEIFE
jgi:hypothetical protein